MESQAGTTYRLCGDAIHEMVRDVMRDNHSQIAKLGVTVQAVFMARTDKDGDAIHGLKVHGVAAAAKIQVTPLVDRARGIADAKMTIDEYTWDRIGDASKQALIDHELEHLMLVDDEKNGGYKRDDLGRPKLKLHPHDWELSGFRSIVERHGEAAIEYQALRQFKAEQLSLFPAGLATL